MVDNEPSQDWFKNGWIVPNICWVIVGGNENAIRPRLQWGAFAFRCKWIVISPNFEVVTQAGVFFLIIFDDDCFLARVTIPPFVGIFNVRFRMGFADTLGLACTCRTPVPFVLESRDWGKCGSCEFVNIGSVFNFDIVFKWELSVGYHRLYTFG